MSKQDKILRKICSKPVPSSITWNEIKTLLISFGYELIRCGKTGGSRRKFYNRAKDDLIICHKPHPSPTVDKGAISDIIQHLKEHGYIKKEAYK